MKRYGIIGLLICLLWTTACGQMTEEYEQQKTLSSSSTQSQESEELEIPRTPVELVRAVDGDTIKVLFEGKEENVRFLLVDTPETSHPKLGEQPFGQEAKAFTKKLVEEADLLELEFDIGQNRDKYSRLLAYVYVDGVMLQELLLQEGLARVAYIYPPNTRYVDQFTAIQKQSQQQGIGIWEVENYAQEDGFHPDYMEEVADNKAGTESGSQSATASTPAPSQPSTEVKVSSSTSDTCTIKGNINSKGEKIYHTTASRWYERTDPEEWFCSEEEAIEAGFRAPR